MKKIILNCSPPTNIYLPSPPVSILKSWLVKNGHETVIIYWNIEFYILQSEFVFYNENKYNEYGLLLFLNYYSIKYSDESIYNFVKIILKSINRKQLTENSSFYDSHMLSFFNMTESLIHDILIRIDLSNVLYFGFTLKMDQWIFANIISRRIKEINASIPIVIGGISNSNCAESFLKNFPQFDFAIWGEGEFSLLNLTEYLKNNTEKYFDNIGNLAYRYQGNMFFSKKNNHSYIDISEENLMPDFSDYYDLIDNLSLRILQKTALPIEGSRGCHWNKCNFCYLNIGYIYRRKSAKIIGKEIRYMIKKYNISTFEFLDNDLVGKNVDEFDKLLNEFIQIKNEYDDFNIAIAEIITKNLNHKLIKKIYNSGITYAQIGYESPSDKLLKKMNKNNTFASNLLYLKFAIYYKAKIGGVNVITNLPEEEAGDIIEACENLKFLRFILNKSIFFHSLIPLSVNSTSRYYSKIRNETDKWHLYNHYHVALINIIEEIHRWNIFEYIKLNRHFLWDHFSNIESKYLNNRFKYKIEETDSELRYIEYLNGREIDRFDISKKSLDAFILVTSCTQIVSLEVLCQKALKYGITISLSIKDEIVNLIDHYNKKGLIYHNSDYSEIVSNIIITSQL
jgi:radical SAM superfamily enzyme YgiQ (UPF0313 family)